MFGIEAGWQGWFEDHGGGYVGLFWGVRTFTRECSLLGQTIFVDRFNFHVQHIQQVRKQFCHFNGGVGHRPFNFSFCGEVWVWDLSHGLLTIGCQHFTRLYGGVGQHNGVLRLYLLLLPRTRLTSDCCAG